MTNEERNLEQLHIHIAGLQATLTKRNEKIAALEKQIAELRVNPVTSKDLQTAHKRGFADCANLMDATLNEAARQFGKINRTAWKLYLEAAREPESK